MAGERKKKKKILLIEDNPGFRLIFGEALEQLGHEVLEAEDGVAGLETAKNLLPDLVLLDLMIPRLRGLEVLKILKSDPATKQIHIVILSVLDDPKEIQECFKHGADDYIIKGSDSPEEVVKKSSALLARANL